LLFFARARTSSTAERIQLHASALAPSMAARRLGNWPISALASTCQALAASAPPLPLGPTDRMVVMAFFRLPVSSALTAPDSRIPKKTIKPMQQRMLSSSLEDAVSLTARGLYEWADASASAELATGPQKRPRFAIGGSAEQKTALHSRGIAVPCQMETLE